jgi:hypothetical protein
VILIFQLLSWNGNERVSGFCHNCPKSLYGDGRMEVYINEDIKGD